MTSINPEPSPPGGPEQEAAPPARPRRRRRDQPEEPDFPILYDPIAEREAALKRRGPADSAVKVFALAAFVFGVLLHGYVVMAVLDSDGDSAVQAPEPTQPIVVETTPTPAPAVQPTATALPDRDDCDEIRGTQYRSVTEREFFLANCTTSLLPPGSAPTAGARASPAV
jgi:hypothetical protein